MTTWWEKKPVRVRAWQFNSGPIPDWVRRAIDEKRICEFTANCYKIKTLEGDMYARYGDWIVEGVANELYPVRDYIFRTTYTPVEEETEAS